MEKCGQQEDKRTAKVASVRRVQKLFHASQKSPVPCSKSRELSISKTICKEHCIIFIAQKAEGSFEEILLKQDDVKLWNKQQNSALKVSPKLTHFAKYFVFNKVVFCLFVCLLYPGPLNIMMKLLNNPEKIRWWNKFLSVSGHTGEIKPLLWLDWFSSWVHIPLYTHRKYL